MASNKSALSKEECLVKALVCRQGDVLPALAGQEAGARAHEAHDRFEDPRAPGVPLGFAGRRLAAEVAGKWPRPFIQCTYDATGRFF